MNDYIVAAIGEWNKKIFEKKSKDFSGNWYFVSSQKELEQTLKVIDPQSIFFFHWRWVVPDKVLDGYECICFHMTDVPYGRGGSPLQNLILKGHKETKLTALRMTRELDAGPVYLKYPLELEGTAEEIYERSALLCWQMVEEIIERSIDPEPQEGEVVYFERRKPEESEIPVNLSDGQLYDFIRMLDAPGYPRAFIRHGDRRFEFDKASLKNGEVQARVRMVKHEK